MKKDKSFNMKIQVIVCILGLITIGAIYLLYLSHKDPIESSQLVDSILRRYGGVISTTIGLLIAILSLKFESAAPKVLGFSIGMFSIFLGILFGLGYIT